MYLEPTAGEAPADLPNRMSQKRADKLRSQYRLLINNSYYKDATIAMRDARREEIVRLLTQAGQALPRDY